ncbi:MAG: 2-oxo acid dehydrogenase subunit E2 [Nitrospira sp.]|nr:2-oxo acid dehydrogenase subunit E2 [Nitrospira sp.]MDH4371244.1 2-oxo acid dehydrogenase subunit E2 [Nitrospira sp.]MDH5348587.1 2-oxo acid dehydrogenase subunit E2 [Nitrospira sp.]MDH5498781.1 2-oxo acid dehydrogenase subunit E2 [Nitrospira sp.]
MNVELPFLAEGIEGGDVVQLLVHEGNQVSEGQSLIELETEKATIPVPSPRAGTVVRVLVQQGDHVKVGQALIELDGSEGETKKAKTSSSTKSAVASVPQPPPTTEAGQENPVEHRKQEEAEPTPSLPKPAQLAAEQNPVAVHKPSTGAALPAPPSVRRLARELGVDLSQVKGSEAGGRITAEDVKAFVRERTKRGATPSAGGNLFSTPYGSERREPLPSIRRKIAANMTQAWTTIPHVHQFQDADITDLMGLHKRYAPEFKKKGATLTLSSLFLKAIVHALKLYPQLNATLDLTNGEVIYKDYYNIGVAVDTPAGLIVPVVHQVDQKDLLQISLELADLAERTRKREIKLEELRGATFTLSNMGGIGAGPFLPIINPPQVGILGVGKARMTPVYRDGQFVPRRVLQLCVAYDHRLVDGAIGARFTNEIVKVLEDFQGMFLGL